MSFRDKIFRPWIVSRHVETPRFFSKIDLDAAGRFAPFQPILGNTGNIDYAGAPLFTGDTGQLYLYQEEFEYFKAWFNARKGKFRTFLFKDFSDFTTTASPESNCINLADQTQGVTYPVAGTAGVYKYGMFKKYFNAGYSTDFTYRRIARPVTSTVKVFAAGALLLASQYSVLETGYIVFNTIPSGVITFDCEYDLLVRFDTDSYSAEVLNATEGEEYFKVSALPIVEVLEVFDLVYVAGPPASNYLCDPESSNTLSLINFNSLHGATERKFNRPSVLGGRINTAILDPFGRNDGVLELAGTEYAEVNMNSIESTMCVEVFVRHTGINIYILDFRDAIAAFTIFLYSTTTGALGIYDRRNGNVSTYQSADNVFRVNEWDFLKVDYDQLSGYFVCRVNGVIVLNVLAYSGSIIYPVSLKIGNGVENPIQSFPTRYFSNLRISRTPRSVNSVPIGPFDIEDC
jgi:uncharacterized protein (TIGR02217 family)